MSFDGCRPGPANDTVKSYDGGLMVYVSDFCPRVRCSLSGDGFCQDSGVTIRGIDWIVKYYSLEVALPRYCSIPIGPQGYPCLDPA